MCISILLQVSSHSSTQCHHTSINGQCEIAHDYADILNKTINQGEMKKEESQSRGVWDWGSLNWSLAPFGALFALITGISNKPEHIEWKHVVEAVNSVRSTLQTDADWKIKWVWCQRRDKIKLINSVMVNGMHLYWAFVVIWTSAL